jgi:hypothetical protein
MGSAASSELSRNHNPLEFLAEIPIHKVLWVEFQWIRFHPLSSIGQLIIVGRTFSIFTQRIFLMRESWFQVDSSLKAGMAVGI